MAFARVSKTRATILLASSPESVNLGATLGTGNCHVVIIRRPPSGPTLITGITDGGNTYTQAITITGQDPHLDVWYAYNTTNAATAISIAFNNVNGSGFAWCECIEYSGVMTAADPLRGAFSHQDGSNTSDFTVGSVNATAGDLVVMATSAPAFLDYNASANDSASNPYTCVDCFIPPGATFSGAFGGVVESNPLAIANALSSGTVHITAQDGGFGSTATGESVLIALKPPASGGGGGKPWLYYAMQQQQSADRCLAS